MLRATPPLRGCLATGEARYDEPFSTFGKALWRVPPRTGRRLAWPWTGVPIWPDSCTALAGGQACAKIELTACARSTAQTTSLEVRSIAVTKPDATSLSFTAAGASTVIATMTSVAANMLACLTVVGGTSPGAWQPVDEPITACSLQCDFCLIARSRSNMRSHYLGLQCLILLRGML